jgi:hypothetical protein
VALSGDFSCLFVLVAQRSIEKIPPLGFEIKLSIIVIHLSPSMLLRHVSFDKKRDPTSVPKRPRPEMNANKQKSRARRKVARSICRFFFLHLSLEKGVVG